MIAKNKKMNIIDSEEIKRVNRIGSWRKMICCVNLQLKILKVYGTR